VKTLENILLTSLRSPFLDDDKIYPPLALLYLKAAINQELPDINVDLMDGEPDTITSFAPYDAVGISIMTPQRQQAQDLRLKLRKFYPNIKLIAGGPHVKHYYTEMKESYWDYLVPGDGERAIVSILKGDAEHLVPDQMSKAELFEMPRPDRTSDKAKALLGGYNYKLQGVESTTAHFGRGCPERCTFCEDAMTGTRWTKPESILEELDDIKSLGYGGVYLFDDLFAIALPKIRPIAQALKDRGLIYRCNAQARYFTKWGMDMSDLLAETGCVEIAFGAETGSQKILDNINKRTTVMENYNTVEYAKRNGINVKAFILLGLPGEDWETLRETEEFIRDSGIDDFQAAVYMPYKGTQIRDAIDKGDDSVDMQMTVDEVSGAYGIKGGETAYEVRTGALSPEDLQGFRNYLVNTYRPKAHEVWKDKFFDRPSVEYEE